MWRTLGLYDTWPGLIIPYMTFTLPLAIYTLVGVLPGDPLGARAGGPGRRRDAVPGLPQGDRAAGRAGRLHRGDPRLHLRLERLRLRDLADLDERRADRARRRSSSSPAPRSSQQPTGSIAAAAVVVTIPIIIMVLIFQRRIVAGLTAGAVKGIRSTPMAEIDARRHHQALPRRLRGRQGHEPRHRRRRVHDPRRPVGLREVDGAADDRRARGHLRRRAEDRRRGRQRPRAEGPRHRDGLPELRALPAHDRAREHGLRAEARQGRQGGDRQEGRGGGADPRPRPSTSTASRPTSPAASASGWRWGARSSATRRRS